MASGEKWVGYGIRSFSATICELVDNAMNSLTMTVYAISDTSIVRSIERALERGVSVEIYIYYTDSSSSNSSIKAILEMEEHCCNLKIHKIVDKLLHAKVTVVDGEKVMCGSANATFAGMVTNYELGVLINNQEIARKILTIMRRLVTE